MQLGMVGLGRMGANMTRRLAAGGIAVAGFDRDHAAVETLATEIGMRPAFSLEELLDAVAQPRTLWLMVPAGPVTEMAVTELAGLLDAGDLLVDGGNANYRDSMRRAALLAARGIEFVDAGVSGGVWGLDYGYALMLGGSAAALARLNPVVRALAPAPDQGWVHTGPAGSGHFAKMVHNGIEYGMMQAYAEGLALLRGRSDWQLDLAAITEAWRHGSVIRSWLLDLTARFLAEDQDLASVQPFVADSGEGRWTLVEAIDQGVSAPVISAALMTRFASQDGLDYTARLLAMMRHAFGGHTTRPTGGD